MSNTPLNSSTAFSRAQNASSSSRALRILVVDDERDSADILAALLRTEGHAVHTVYGGREALDDAREFNPDVILLDIGMPKITGYEVARRLRQRYGSACPVLIAVTGWGQASDKILATLAGFDHHIAKPYEAAQLLGLLSQPGSRQNDIR